MKKGMGSQVFIYLIALIVLGTIFIFGYKMIAGLVKLDKDVSETKFASDFLKNVNRIRSSTGRVETITLSVPSDVKKVCFIDLGFDKTAATGSGSNYICDDTNTSAYLPILCNSWGNREFNNMFFVTDELEIPLQKYVGDVSKCDDSGDSGYPDCYGKTSYIKLDSEPHYFCSDSQSGQVKIRLTGIAGKVKIE